MKASLWKRARSAAGTLLLATPLAAGLAGCDFLPAPDPKGESFAGKVPVFDKYDYETPPDLARGQKVYVKHCAGCHGDQGDGKGLAAPWLDPKPRNFQEARFKFSSTPSGKLPTDEDLMRTLTTGAHGTSMPEWSLLPEPDLRAVIAYIKTFSARWTTEEKASPIPMGLDPYQEDPTQGILDGEIVYHAVATCWSCHPAYASVETLNILYEEDEKTPPTGYRDNLFHSLETTSSEGDKLYPPDFVWDPIKSGTDLKQIYLRIAAGITGTAMPTWSGVLPEDDIWAMAHYVRYLATEQRLFPCAPEDRKPFADRFPEGVYPILVPEEEGSDNEVAESASAAEVAK
jgi:mono/diheme cytochrome c family protein